MSLLAGQCCKPFGGTVQVLELRVWSEGNMSGSVPRQTAFTSSSSSDRISERSYKTDPVAVSIGQRLHRVGFADNASPCGQLSTSAKQEPIQQPDLNSCL